jgi:hypothetical protein
MALWRARITKEFFLSKGKETEELSPPKQEKSHLLPNSVFPGLFRQRSEIGVMQLRPKKRQIIPFPFMGDGVSRPK